MGFAAYRLIVLRVFLPTAMLIAVWLVPRGAEAARAAESTTTGTLEGKLTDWRSVPLADAVVLVRNLATGATARIVTGKNGS